MAQGRKTTPEEKKQIQESALKPENTRLGEDGIPVVNVHAVSNECGFSDDTVKKYTVDDESFGKLWKDSWVKAVPLAANGIVIAGELINVQGKEMQKAIHEEPGVALSANVQAYVRSVGDYVKTVRLVAGEETEIIGGSIEVKKFDEW